MYPHKRGRWDKSRQLQRLHSWQDAQERLNAALQKPHRHPSVGREHKVSDHTAGSGYEVRKRLVGPCGVIAKAFVRHMELLQGREGKRAQETHHIEWFLV